MTDLNEIQKIDRDTKIFYIYDNINELRLQTRKDILQTIMNSSSISEDKIIEKGSGTQIIFAHINNDLLSIIYNLIKNKLDTSEETLKFL